MLNLRSFALAGRAVFTVTSKATGTRFTFRVKALRGADNKIQENGPHFVSVLTGADNTNDFSVLGTIFSRQNYVHNSRKSRISKDAPSAKAFDWVWRNINDQEKLDASMEIHHEGKCCRCGRALTVPESIESGIGPECATKVF